MNEILISELNMNVRIKLIGIKDILFFHVTIFYEENVSVNHKI